MIAATTRTPDLYTGVDKSFRYGKDDTTYAIAGAYLSGPGLVEDWGCGASYARRFIGAPYRGIDGIKSKFASVVVDLATYRSTVPKILMRGVLEHNLDWRTILENLLCSFTDRAVLILFMPPGPVDVNRSDDPEWPAMTLCEPDLDAILRRHADVSVTKEDFVVDTEPVNWERIYFMERR